MNFFFQTFFALLCRAAGNKRIILLIVFSYAFASYSQTFLKVNLTDKMPAVSTDLKSKLDSVNRIIAAFKVNRDTANLRLLQTMLKDTMLNHYKNIEQIREATKTATILLANLSLDSVAKKISLIPVTNVRNVALDSLNKRIIAFKSNPDSNNLKSMDTALIKADLKNIPEADKIKDAINQIKDTTKINSLDSIAKALVTVQGNSKISKADSLCPNLKNIKIKYILGDAENSYLGIVEDSTGNTMESFTITQSNKELFYDKLKTALNNLCTDTAGVNDIIKKERAEDHDLYTLFLEAKEDFANTNGLAGVLKIYRNLQFYTDQSSDNFLQRINNSSAIDPKMLKQNVSTAKQNLKEIKKSKKITKRQAKKIIRFARKMNLPIDTLIVQRALDTANSNADKTMTAQLTALASRLGKVKPLTATIENYVFDTAASITIQQIQIQFQDGFIENIKVFCRRKNDPHVYRFENGFPIAFSTKKDFRNMVNIWLYEKSDYIKNESMYLRLCDVISYNQNLGINNKDYAPANQVLTVDDLKSTDTVREVALFKDQTSRILELQVFSDLKGTDNNNPNGLIQIELNKKLNLFSKRKSLLFGSNAGLFNFVTPQLSLNKIEENQKRLVLSTIDTLTLTSDSSKPIAYTSTINLLSHQIYKVGFDVSIVLMDVPAIKSNFEFGTGLHFGRSSIQDTLKNKTPSTSNPSGFAFEALKTNNVLQYGINTFQWGPYFKWQIFPDKRFGVSATQRFTWFKALTSNFVQVRDSAHYLKFIAQARGNKTSLTNYQYYNYGSSNSFVSKFSLFSRCIASTEIFAYFSPNADGSNKLFFRYRLNWDVANSKENFQQIQVGFSTYINSTKEYGKLKKNANISD